MGRIIDLTNQRFGRLLVLKLDCLNKKPGAYWYCQCDCGKVVSVRGQSLRTGNTKSCGCLQKEMSSKKNMTDLTGQVFGRLTVLERDSMRRGNHAYWICKCECGQIKSVDASGLKTGRIQSCGCLASKGEYLIGKYLQELNIKYQTQYFFSDLRGKKLPLRFDFAILNDENSIVAFIEYQGQQHYKSVEYFGGNERLKMQQEYDTKKKEYCKQIKIPLIEISYKEIDLLSKDFLKERIKEVWQGESPPNKLNK